MAGHSHYNQKQHHEQRMRDEGSDGKHMRGDSSVPIVGKHGARIHGEHTGEMANDHMPPTHQMQGRKMSHVEGMGTDPGAGRMKKGKPGDHEENA
jgi:hypothetical protein